MVIVVGGWMLVRLQVFVWVWKMDIGGCWGAGEDETKGR